MTTESKTNLEGEETWHAEAVRQTAKTTGFPFLDRWAKWAGVGVPLVASQRIHEGPTPTEVALVLGWMMGEQIARGKI